MKTKGRSAPVPLRREMPEVMLCQISPDEWRVLDGRFEPSHLRALLGFIHVREDRYEAVRMDEPNLCRLFASLAAAKADFAHDPVQAARIA